MTREARLTQKRLEGEIGKLLEGKQGYLYQYFSDGEQCAFCKKWQTNISKRTWNPCGHCPIYIGNGEHVCQSYSGYFQKIGDAMLTWPNDAIPGALAIYMWLEEL